MILYDFIAPLVGHISGWNAHLERIEAMGFSAVKFSPLYMPGRLSQVYTAHAYDTYHPLFFGDVGAEEAERLFRDVVDRARVLDLDVILDIAIHQMASDSPLTAEHPEWFGKETESTPEGAVAFDYASHGDEIIRFHAERIKKFLALGVGGFRARSAHQVEGRWWSQLIDAARSDNPNTFFLAEMFGSTEEKQGGVASAGFNLVFNSFHWWNLVDEWYGRQQRILSEHAKTLCPVELSDTPRVAAGCGSVKEVAQQRYLISAAMGANIATGLGFEYGFNRMPDPCTCSPADWEEARYDISPFIAHVNRFRRSEPGLRVDGPIETTSMLHGPLRLVSKPLEERRGRVWTIINTDMENRTWGVAETDLPANRAFRWTGGGETIEACNPLDLPQHFEPAEVRILFDE